MVATPNRNRQAERREATRQEILAAAWDVAHRGGLANLNLREIATQVGMRAPSLYSHFESKNAIYDAMFEQAWQGFLTVLTDRVASFSDEPRACLLGLATVYFDYAVEDLERHQIMDMPMLPDFTPSEQAYRPSVECYSIMQATLRRIGIRKESDVALYTALIGGLVNQQLANDPKGDRWRRVIPRAMRMFADDVGLPVHAVKKARRTT